MSALPTRLIQLKSRPEGDLAASDLEIVDGIAASPAEAEVQVRNIWMSVDPYMLNRLYDRPNYVPPFKLGRPLDGGAVGEVIASAHPDFQPGDLVLNTYGWREAFTAPGKRLTRIEPSAITPQDHLGVAGLTGMTAYVGLLRIAGLKAGDTVFVSAAAGAVGTVACQIAKLIGCRVIGSAGGAAKAAFLRNKVGVDHAIDYRAENDLSAALADAAPNGIDVYFENVGGDHFNAALDNAAVGARFALCGMIAQYGDGQPPLQARMFHAISKRIRMEGFLLGDHDDLKPAFERDIAAWLADGSVRSFTTVSEGLESAPEAFRSLLTGGNTGKMLVRL
ncbi:NADP-dependent oxidoreductase [Brevundimonas sp. NPDC090276]|uniref:NADP-dependent oxidoreductase n=1 Tax=Brevundimonas sp. NPDC090276 TaxID=3363956 RepID=UPI00383AAB2C